jgi:transcriptional regulator with XRE-family HTH domain
MPPEPPVLTRLKALGLRQRVIAEYLGASTSAVSAWCTGKNPFHEPYRTEAEALLAVVSEHLAHGGTLETLAFRPAVFINPGATTQSSETTVPWQELRDLYQLEQELADQSPDYRGVVVSAWHARSNAARLAARLDIDPQTWQPSARELDDIRRLIEAARLHILNLLKVKAIAALKEELHVDQTP